MKACFALLEKIKKTNRMSIFSCWICVLMGISITVVLFPVTFWRLAVGNWTERTQVCFFCRNSVFGCVSVLCSAFLFDFVLNLQITSTKRVQKQKNQKSVNLFHLWSPGGAALVAVCDAPKQEEIVQCMKALGLFCHRPYYYARIKPRGLKTYENVSPYTYT